MSLSFDDKLLGEKVDNYCSSSEDEQEEMSEGEDEESAGKQNTQQEQTEATNPQFEYQVEKGHCINTGPKGVVNDWRRYRQLENEKRREKDAERRELAKKFSMTCRSYNDDIKDQEEDKELESILGEVSEEMDDFMQEYRRKRFEELKRAYIELPKFGKVFNISPLKFVEEIDKESPRVTILVHIYEIDNRACDAVDGCFINLAVEYPSVKFCRMRATDANMSRKFTRDGVPAILVYKQGELVGNMVRVSKDLGEDFYAPDMESYLLERGFLPDITTDPVLKMTSIRESNRSDPDREDSDYDID